MESSYEKGVLNFFNESLFYEVMSLIESEEMEMMQKAYCQLYEIENRLRSYISGKMLEEYGPCWFLKAPKQFNRKPPRAKVQNLNLHELERSLLRLYPPFQELPDDFFLKLRILYPIRNQIAHSKCLGKDQVDSLSECHTYLINQLS
ncbi:hypothetical protein ACTWQL_22815 [Pseudalkalibacillus sp. R45]|uniref:hypothetical protein n=1 Tax=Pseudalkalibacillus sp. R45 TaxID=3457433 RepID=UPI003FCD9F06